MTSSSLGRMECILQRIETLQLDPRSEEADGTKVDDDMTESDGQSGRNPESTTGCQDSAGDSDSSQKGDSGTSGMESPEPAKCQLAGQKGGQLVPSNEAKSTVGLKSKSWSDYG